jgi:ribosomal protein RSM22 (predicted rRNA methylase)
MTALSSGRRPRRIVRGMSTSLRARIDEALAGTKASTLAVAVERLVATYRSGEAAATPILASTDDVLAYVAYRMPATYAVARAVLQQLHDGVPHLRPHAVTDFGAGTGAVGWAASAVWPALGALNLLEQSEPAIALGQQLMRDAECPALRAAHWRSWRLSRDSERKPAADLTADVATAAYVLGELTRRQQALLLATMVDTAPTVVLIEPGTSAGFERIVKARAALIAAGLTILAPCPHDGLCPMAERGDWCHFAERLERSRLHRALKGGELSYEDEKYSYVAAGRGGADRPGARILRHPQLRRGLVTLQLCAASGDAVELKVSKSQGALYKQARRARWGDKWPPTGPSAFTKP